MIFLSFRPSTANGASESSEKGSSSSDSAERNKTVFQIVLDEMKEKGFEV